jgi:hypothetical protein
MQRNEKILSNDEILNMIEDMASEGHAPNNGCSLFGVGNDEYINILKEIYIEKRFKRGASAEKFVVGPFGSGKTHFVNQLSEIARQLGCVTSMVSLYKDVDVTSNYAIYREIVQEIRTPNNPQRGIVHLLHACFDSIKNNTLKQTGDEKESNALLKIWIDSLETDSDFELDIFGRIIKQAFDALLKDDKEKFDAASRWIHGEFQNREIAKLLNIQTFTKNELNLIGSRVNLSLYQLIKKSGFLGTVVVFDEAEQGFEIGKKKQGILYSLMQSDINSIVNLKGGSALILYAIVPQIKEGMMNFPALQQRVQHPFPFGEDNPRAPLIEIHRAGETPDEIIKELIAIGKKLTDLMYIATGSEISIPKNQVNDTMKLLAERTIQEDISISSRRMMVKNACTVLTHLYENNKIMDIEKISLSLPQSDLDDEV